MKYNVGDVVRVKSREWYEANKDKLGSIDFGIVSFTSCMLKYCGVSAVVSAVEAFFYKLEGIEPWVFTDEMLEDALDTGKAYWVSDESEDAAKRNKQERIFAVMYKGENYFESSIVMGLSSWKYAVPVEESAEYFIVKKQGGEVTETKLTEKQREELGL
jgi:hypothetical protein